MAVLRRVNGVLSAWFPEKRLFIQSGASTRYLRLTPLSQLLTCTAGLALTTWLGFSTATTVIAMIDPDRGSGGTVAVQEAYRTRLDELAGERDRRAAEARSAQAR